MINTARKHSTGAHDQVAMHVLQVCDESKLAAGMQQNRHIDTVARQSVMQKENSCFIRLSVSCDWLTS